MLDNQRVEGLVVWDENESVGDKVWHLCDN